MLTYIGDYDSLGRLSKEEVQNSSDSSFIGSAEYGYDVRNNLTSLVTTYGGDTRYQYYYYSEHEKAPNSAKYAKDNLPTYYQLYYNSRYAIYDYDGLNRLNQRKFTLDVPLYYNYIYKSSDRNASGETLYRTTQISKEFIGNDVFVYGYDVLGNITSIKKATRSGDTANSTSYTGATDYVTYTYDDLGQLTRENNKTKNKTTLWTYNELGNITAKTEYAYTTGTPSTATKTVTYGYGKDSKSGWNNLLVSVDNNGNGTTESGESISYDSIGNPTTYLGATLTWNGRQLTSYITDDKEITYTYDANGLRATKIQKDYTVAEDGTKTLTKTTETKYYYVNGQLHYQDTLATKADGTTVVTKLYFYYDSYGYLSCIKYNGSNYYVATNKRGDVVALYYYDGRIMGRYEYDAWGNVIKIEDISYDSAGNATVTDLTNNTTSRDLLVVNPIRYRSYYYDAETELYYLQSRYYNAEIGRFLNADGYLTTGQGVLSYNMFAYCGNNPVMYSDPSGCFWGKIQEWLQPLDEIIYEYVVENLKDSSNKYARALGNALDFRKTVEDSIDPFADLKKNTQKVLDNADCIKEQYVNDILDKHSGKELSQTPDPYVFKDVDKYNQKCAVMYNRMFDDTVNAYNGGFSRSYAVENMIIWDPLTTISIGLVTSYYELEVIFKETANLMG